MDIVILQNVWFCLLALLLGMFIALGGFDFGACMLAAKSRRASDLAIGSILPFWDANQVWLITAGGALFAAFPIAYSDVLSNLYIPVMLLLASIIVRIASIEFYFANEDASWRTFWRYAASASSFLSVLLLGVALGVIFTGKVFGRTGGFFESFFALFTFSTVLCGLALVFFSCTHGALFICYKTKDGAKVFYKECKVCFYGLLVLFALYVLSLSLSLGQIIFFCAAYAFVLVSHMLFLRKRFGLAVIFNGLFALTAVAAHAFAAYPAIVPPEVTIANSSSFKTLAIMLGVAGVGVPIILVYTFYSYRVFLKKKE